MNDNVSRQVSASSMPIKHSIATRLFHHIGLLLLAGTWVLIEFESSFANAIGLHKAFGVSFLLWTLARLMNALVRPRLPKLAQPTWQIGLMHLTHFGLYGCMLAMPISGVLMSVYGGRPVDVFGIFQIPVFVTPDRDLSKLFNGLHTDIIFVSLLALIGAHIVGALYHQLILKDRLLSRML